MCRDHAIRIITSKLRGLEREIAVEGLCLHPELVVQWFRERGRGLRHRQKRMRRSAPSVVELAPWEQPR
jgi:hypothetical protein